MPAPVGALARPPAARDSDGADPAQATRLICELAAGNANRLSGRHLTVADDLHTPLAQIEQIERDDLHTLRLRTSAAVN